MTIVPLALAVCTAMASAETALRNAFPDVFHRAVEHYKALDAAASAGQNGEGPLFPHGFDRTKCRLVMDTGTWWTSGHFPGSLWYLYEGTGDEELKRREDGRVQEIRRGQGSQVGSAWSRGQSWAIYGYTMMYRETGMKEYLAFAQKVTDSAINHPNMPADGVPYWDFGAPGEERDSSAAAVMASGLLELCRYVDPEKSAKYRAFAVRQLLTLASEDYFSRGDEAGHFLLKHGVGNKPRGIEVDVPLNYGDYYFLEALLRFRSLHRSAEKPG